MPVKYWWFKPRWLRSQRWYKSMCMSANRRFYETIADSSNRDTDCIPTSSTLIFTDSYVTKHIRKFSTRWWRNRSGDKDLQYLVIKTYNKKYVKYVLSIGILLVMSRRPHQLKYLNLRLTYKKRSGRYPEIELPHGPNQLQSRRHFSLW